MSNAMFDDIDRYLLEKNVKVAMYYTIQVVDFLVQIT